MLLERYFAFDELLTLIATRRKLYETFITETPIGNRGQPEKDTEAFPDRIVEEDKHKPFHFIQT